jgi:DNA-binding NarL/FixJ family response regulator
LSKFLVVEDNPALARSVASVLKKYGDTIHAGSVRDANLALATNPRFSAGIFDVRLPDGSGFEVLRKFRTRQPSHPALVLTGYFQHDDINAAFDMEADYIVKPFKAARIHQFIRTRVLSHHDSRLGLPMDDQRSTGHVSVNKREVESWELRLTETERTVLTLLREGLPNWVISRKLFVSVETVRTHVGHIFSKLDVHSRKELCDFSKRRSPGAISR